MHARRHSGDDARQQHVSEELRALRNCARLLLRASPDGMCGGLLTHRLRECELPAIEAVYGESREAQKGWLQDLVRSIPEVRCRTQGRDKWYYVDSMAQQEERQQADSEDEEEEEEEEEDIETFGPSDGSECAEPTVAGESDAAPMTPAREALAECIRALLRDSRPEGMSRSSLGIRLRKLAPDAIEDLHQELRAEGGPQASVGSALHDLVEAMPDVRVQPRMGSIVYALTEARSPALAPRLPSRDSPPSSPEQLPSGVGRPHSSRSGRPGPLPEKPAQPVIHSMCTTLASTLRAIDRICCRRLKARDV